MEFNSAQVSQKHIKGNKIWIPVNKLKSDMVHFKMLSWETNTSYTEWNPVSES